MPYGRQLLSIRYEISSWPSGAGCAALRLQCRSSGGLYGRWSTGAPTDGKTDMNLIAMAWKWLCAWITGHGAHLALCLRSAAAAVLGLALAQLLHVPLPLWTVLTAVIVTQMSVGRPLQAIFDYLLGTCGGAIYAGVLGVLVRHDNEILLLVLLGIVVAPLALLASIMPSFAVAPFTGVLVLLAPTIIHLDPIASALYRLVEVALGAGAAFIVCLPVLPVRKIWVFRASPNLPSPCEGVAEASTAPIVPSSDRADRT